MPHTVVPAVDHRARPSTDSVTPGPVLVVDDEPLICWLVGQYLRAEGYEVLQALDGD
jgi:PleD family two-component response regulator